MVLELTFVLWYLSVATVRRLVYSSIIICDSNISGNDDCVESKPLLFVFLYEEISNSCFQIKVQKHKLRISILFIFRHCWKLPFPNYPILLITLNAMHVTSPARIFFLLITASRIFFRQVSLAGIFFLGNCHPTWFFVVVLPLRLSRKLFGDFQVC